MKPLYPPLSDPAALPRRVLCIAPHPDDEVLGCGGMLAFHAARGDDVRVVILSDGSLGDPDANVEDITAERKRETEAAGRELGVTDHVFLDLPDGRLGEVADLVGRLTAELDDFAPELCYVPSPLECHPDHRVTSHAAVAALAKGPERRVFLYGVNTPVTASVVFDTTAQWPVKRAAIERYQSQLAYHDMVDKCRAWDRARTVNMEDPAVEVMEAYVDLSSGELATYEGRVALLLDLVAEGSDLAPAAATAPATADEDEWAATAVISTWNKVDDVCANLDAIRAQTRPFKHVVVVDNASSDGTAQTIKERYPEVNLTVMPNSAYGACETFNIGFASVVTPLTAILDDDVVLTPQWLEKTVARLKREPESTAVISTKIIEPGMPESYKSSPAINEERYMSTFRGCASLARSDAIKEAGYYDERLFIYGNERDLTCRLLNLGYRVLQYPEVEAHHGTPFGIKMGKRSLYYHARNAWLGMLKYAPLEDLLRMPFLVVGKVLLRGSKSEEAGEVTDATGTIGIGRSIRETPGALGVLLKAAFSVLYNVPYCLKRRAPCSHPDFELPLE